MSRYAPNIEREGIAWDEAGKWKQGQDIVHLQTLADKMVIPPDAAGTDILNSIPTPWSRLLLFESALFNDRHPTHREILSQWRGLIGLLALADPLGIKIFPADQEMTINLSAFAAQSPIAKTFLDLAPSYLLEDQDVEAGKWEDFHFISVEDQIIGATSPRTLVFTGVSPLSSSSAQNTTSSLPESIPFFADGRIYDPLVYYRRFNDQKYLTLLKSWLAGFINVFANNQTLINWLGVFPAPPGAAAERRHDKLLTLFRAWLNEVNQAVTGEIPLPEIGQFRQHFTLHGYGELKFLPEIPYDPASDLLLDTQKAQGRNVVVCYRPDYDHKAKKNSMLYNDRNMRIQSDNIHISQGRWSKADAPLPEKMRFLPDNWEAIADPIEEFFEDKLIEINLPSGEDVHSVYSLGVNVKNFLFPFKEKILNYFEPEEINRYTTISIEPNEGYVVTLEVPLRGASRRKILASRIYEESSNELAILNQNNKHTTAELAMFPKFQSPNWKYHYYFKRSLSKLEVDFTPVSAITPRQSPDKKSSWYFSTEPVTAFIGKLDDNKGLLLPRYENLEPSAGVDFWNVSVDFGSTHTRAFCLEMQPHDGAYIQADGAPVEQIKFTTYARQLTLGDAEQLKNDFFALEGKITPSERAELKTLLMRPINNRNSGEAWSPRDGFGYMHWIHSGFDSRRIKSDIKWEGTGSNDDLRSYLRWLMVQIMAEAEQKNARIVKVLRSYPSSFNETLKAQHNAEWVALADFMGNEVEIRAFEEGDDELLSEAVATARYLSVVEGAPAIQNTISFDVGGSTTDIAVWYGKADSTGQRKPMLGAQESVKLAAGLVGRFLQTDPQAKEFLDWFVGAVNNQEKIKNISLDAFEGRKNGYALMFYNILSYYEQGGDELRNNLNALTGSLKRETKAAKLLAHIIFMFGGLIYYSGQLARKVGLQESGTQNYHLYFCGKGGTLIKWLNEYQLLVKKLFVAGLFGPESKVSPEDQNKISVNVNISAKPKEEVGRGLLVKFAYQELGDDEETFGLFDLRAPSVTVGETGYFLRPNIDQNSPNAAAKQTNEKLEWNAKLDERTMRRLDSHVPPLKEMKELNHFIQAISKAFRFQDERSPIFDFNGLLNNHEEIERNFVDAVTARLFNTDESGIQFRLQNENDPGALVEPLLITEMKVLLEFLSGNDQLFK